MCEFTDAVVKMPQRYGKKHRKRCHHYSVANGSAPARQTPVLSEYCLDMHCENVGRLPVKDPCLFSVLSVKAP